QQVKRLGVEIKTPVLNEAKDRRRRDRLRNAGDAEQGVRLYRLLGFDIRPAVAAGQRQPAVLYDRELSARNLPLLHQVGDEAVITFHAGDGLARRWKLRR